MMTTIATKENSMINATATESHASVHFRSSAHDAGHESGHVSPSADFEVDVLGQLKANLSQLEDLHGRLKHMMGELSYLLKRG